MLKIEMGEGTGVELATESTWASLTMPWGIYVGHCKAWPSFGTPSWRWANRESGGVMSGHQRILQTNGSFLDTQAVLKVTCLLALQGSRHDLESDINSDENTQSCGG